MTDERHCAHCGAPFEPLRRDNVWCSLRCKKRGQDARRRRRLAATEGLTLKQLRDRRDEDRKRHYIDDPIRVWSKDTA